MYTIDRPPHGPQRESDLGFRRGHGEDIECDLETRDVGQTVVPLQGIRQGTSSEPRSTLAHNLFGPFRVCLDRGLAQGRMLDADPVLYPLQLRSNLCRTQTARLSSSLFPVPSPLFSLPLPDSHILSGLAQSAGEEIFQLSAALGRLEVI